MPWIEVRRPSPENPALQAALEAQSAMYPAEYNPAQRSERRVPEPVMNDSIVMSHSLIPAALRHAFGTFGALMSPDLPLSRRQHEMIALTVSALNSCFYWIESHAEFLRIVTLDEDFANALRRDWRTAQLSEPDRTMLGYVEKVTKAPVSISQDDIAALRSVGFDDTGILQINLIASWFNYINRVADGLGVGRT